MAKAAITRRQFLKVTSIAGISAYIAPFGSLTHAALFEQELLTPIRWNAVTGLAQFRIDGTAKVTGAKIFSYDIRARDLPNWPDEQSHALILRTTRADAVYDGFDLSRLDEGLQPDRTVTAADLERDGLKFPAFYGDDMLLPPGKTPAYLGQAVAILIFHDFARFRLAKNALQFQTDIIRYGKETGPLVRDPWGVFRYVRVGGETPFDPDVFSSLKDAPVFPSQMRKQLPVWPDGKDHGKLDEVGMYYADAIRNQLNEPAEEWLVVNRRYQTQSVDTSAMELDNANCWYDAKERAMHMVVPSQSPAEVATAAATMLAQSGLGVKILVLHPCYTVGYGSKDHFSMPFYGLVCAVYGDGRPVRIANDRYEQFQSSLKRHAFDLDYHIAVDRKTGLIQRFAADMVANGGGRANFSASVAMVGATAAQAIYYFPQSDITARADATRAVDAGSARGYGTLQSMAATEMLIEELANELKLDPIEFRLKNVLKSGMKNTQGAIPAGASRADEVLKRASEHPIWINRKARKSTFEAENPAKVYGVGFGCVQKDFGTGAESSLAKVEISAEGQILLRHTGAEIGTGMSTSQALACVRYLGTPATDVGFSITDWPDLPMKTSGDPYLMQQGDQDRLMADPLWTPAFASPSSASNSAFYFTHTTQEACRVVFENGIWPAAMAIWSSGIGSGQAAPYVVRRDDARWVDGKLTAAGMQPLSLPELASKAYEMGLVVGAVVHGFNRWQWAEAEFQLGDQVERMPIDGLAVYYAPAAGAGGKASTAASAFSEGDPAAAYPDPHDTGQLMAQDVTAVAPLIATSSVTAGHYQVLPRRQVFYPPVQRNNAAVTYYSAMGTVVELAIHRNSGEVEVLNHHSVIECGTVLSPELVSGQIQGGIAMGIGHVLHEYLPLYENGPGNGTWNFNRYHLPRATDVAVWSQTAEVLPGLSDTDPPKGMAEVVMIPIVAAVANAVADATGHRFYSLPITAAQIQEALT